MMAKKKKKLEWDAFMVYHKNALIWEKLFTSNEDAEVHAKRWGPAFKVIPCRITEL